jgi:hypothetical protein
MALLPELLLCANEKVNDRQSANVSADLKRLEFDISILLIANWCFEGKRRPKRFSETIDIINDDTSAVLVAANILHGDRDHEAFGVDKRRTEGDFR